MLFYLGGLTVAAGIALLVAGFESDHAWTRDYLLTNAKGFFIIGLVTIYFAGWIQ